MAIRYDKKLNQEINRTIKNFNQKIARLEKENRELLLPGKITKKELKENVYTRSELKRKLKDLQSFSKRGVEETMETKGGVKLSVYEYNIIKKENKRVKQQLSRDIKMLEVTPPKVLGKKQYGTYAQMGDTHYLNLKARRKALEKDITSLGKEEFETFKGLIKKTARNKDYMNDIFKENYIKILTDEAYRIKYDEDKLKHLKDTLMKLKPNKFLKLFTEDKAIASIMDYYPIVTHRYDKTTGKRIIDVDDESYENDLTELYDALIDNIDEIVEDYA